MGFFSIKWEWEEGKGTLATSILCTFIVSLVDMAVNYSEITSLGRTPLVGPTAAAADDQPDAKEEPPHDTNDEELDTDSAKEAERPETGNQKNDNEEPDIESNAATESSKTVRTLIEIYFILHVIPIKNCVTCPLPFQIKLKML